MSKAILNSPNKYILGLGSICVNIILEEYGFLVKLYSETIYGNVLLEINMYRHTYCPHHHLHVEGILIFGKMFLVYKQKILKDFIYLFRERERVSVNMNGGGRGREKLKQTPC